MDHPARFVAVDNWARTRGERRSFRSARRFSRRRPPV